MAGGTSGKPAWQSVLAFIGVVAVIAALGYGWLRMKTEERFDECEAAMENYVAEGGAQPGILSEDWCFEHLMDEADVPDELREP